ncbi:hypothetical protein DXA10_07980 [Firmicutes bacterium AM55-24TS]|nr:hypothetical protein DXA10_07980 [Firmicutes bacterium AM55-24TS]RHP03454.1 hypothetical protein DW004_09775 [Firmicutes bacterium AF36-3BH]
MKWYKSGKAEYRLTAYDEYGNESDGKLLTDVSIDNSDIAAVLFSQPNITEKMSLYIATGKETDEAGMVIIRLTYRMVFLADVFQLTEEQCLSIQAILKTV